MATTIETVEITLTPKSVTLNDDHSAEAMYERSIRSQATGLVIVNSVVRLSVTPEEAAKIAEELSKT